MPNGRFADLDAPPDQRTYATFIHVAPLIAHMAGLGTGLFGLAALISLVMWRIRAKDSAFLDDHGKETLNFHLSMFFYGLTASALTALLVGIVPLILLFFIGIVSSIRAARAANRGEFFRYPITIRLIA
jgi:uncharacterized Tic20 family protein